MASKYAVGRKISRYVPTFRKGQGGRKNLLGLIEEEEGPATRTAGETLKMVK